MKWHIKVITLILGMVIGMSIGSITTYYFSNVTMKSTFSFSLLVFSAWTSLAGLGVSLWVFKMYSETVNNPFETISEKTGRLIDDFNEGFLEDLIDSIIQAEKRFANLPRKKQKKIVLMVERYSNVLFERVEQMSAEKPSKEIKQAKPKENTDQKQED